MNYDLELKKAIDEINTSEAKRVCVQLPDGLKQRADSIVQKLKENTEAEIYIWAGSCFGSCDTPDHLDKLDFDLLIQWGHSAWE